MLVHRALHWHLAIDDGKNESSRRCNGEDCLIAARPFSKDIAAPVELWSCCESRSKHYFVSLKAKFNLPALIHAFLYPLSLDRMTVRET